ncbi:MAG: adenosylcobinamide-GDP ribazoletransferase [Candidatus Nanopelagicales bacterium]
MRSLRLAIGLLTVIPVGDVGDVDRRVAGRAMLWAPAVGLVLGGIGAVIAWTVHALVPTTLGALLASVLAISTLVYLTRALHLDGLADTADALGSGKAAADALAIAHRGDVGPFGVVAVLIIVLIQVASLAVLVSAGSGAIALVLAVATGRLAATLACARGIAAARPGGLGALVAGTVPRWAVLAWALALVLAALAAGTALTTTPPWSLPLGVGAGLVVAALMVRRAVRRLNGVTGDVMGAAVESATTALLLTAALTATVGA